MYEGIIWETLQRQQRNRPEKLVCQFMDLVEGFQLPM